MEFPLWGKVALWAGVVFVFFLNLWYTPYAVLVAWAVPKLWDRWHRHLEVMEELVYFVGKKRDEHFVEEPVSSPSTSE